MEWGESRSQVHGVIRTGAFFFGGEQTRKQTGFFVFFGSGEWKSTGEVHKSRFVEVGVVGRGDIQNREILKHCFVLLFILIVLFLSFAVLCFLF